MKYTCPEFQKIFKETPLLEDFTAKCPHCGAELSIPADTAKVERARKEAKKIEEEERKQTQAESHEAARKEVVRKLEEENAKAVALVERSLKRICPHCGTKAVGVYALNPLASS